MTKETFTINRDSWHAKMVEGIVFLMPNDLCGYMKALLGAMALNSLAILAVFLNAFLWTFVLESYFPIWLTSFFVTITLTLLGCLLFRKTLGLKKYCLPVVYKRNDQ